MYVYMYMYMSVCLYTISPIIMWGLPFEYLSFWEGCFLPLLPYADFFFK